MRLSPRHCMLLTGRGDKWLAPKLMILRIRKASNKSRIKSMKPSILRSLFVETAVDDETWSSLSTHIQKERPIGGPDLAHRPRTITGLWSGRHVDAHCSSANHTTNGRYSRPSLSVDDKPPRPALRYSPNAGGTWGFGIVNVGRTTNVTLRYHHFSDYQRLKLGVITLACLGQFTWYYLTAI